MSSIPAQIEDYVRRSMFESRFPAYLAVLPDLQLAEYGGDLARYGIVGLRKGSDMADAVPILDGYFPLEGEPTVLRRVTLRPGVTADIHLFSADGMDWAVLIGASPDDDHIQVMQQAFNDRQRELDAVQRLSRALASATSESLLVNAALRVALDLVGAEAGAVLLPDPKSDMLVYRYVEGSSQEHLDKPVGEGTVLEVYRSGRSRTVDHASSPGDAVTASTNMIAVPLIGPQNASGVLLVLDKRDGPFQENDVRILEIVAAQIGLSIEQTRLHQEEKLAQVARLLGNISHDVKNLLTPVVSGISVLETIIADLYAHTEKADGAAGDLDSMPIGGYPPDFHIEVLEMMQEAARRMQDRMKEIADCVKGVTTPLTISSCDLNDLVLQVQRVLGPVAEQDHITLARELGVNLPRAEADCRMMYSLLYNLTDNAMAAVRRANRPGRITVATLAEQEGMFPEGGFLMINVTDTGCGMTEEIQERLFSTGVRSTSTLGTGLGTKIIKDVVDAHGGLIWVESTLDVGTSFHIKLPISQAQGKKKTVPPTAQRT